MLGAKRTLKERWDKLLNEAPRIQHKHLITLDVSVSSRLLARMKNSSFQLVVPGPLQVWYSDILSGELLEVRGFLDLVKKRQI